MAIKPGGEVPYTMGYFNADGTPAEMCGNGLRCTMQFLADLGEPVREMPEVPIMTGAGPVTCRYKDERVIQVSMPIPSYDPRDAKINAQGDQVVRQGFEVPGMAEPVVGTAVGVGNPHFVMFRNEMWEGNDVHEIGGRLSLYRDLFPEGINVGFARQESENSCAVVVHERGVGPTLACGSGAIAAVAAGIKEDRFQFEQPVQVRMPGGTLVVTIGKESSYAVLEGTAVKVYDGTVKLPLE
jgi:diaminopimelate epimerase